MEKPNLATSQLCVITVAFPYADDTEMLSVKNGIIEATKDIGKVKIDVRLVSMRGMAADGSMG